MRFFVCVWLLSLLLLLANPVLEAVSMYVHGCETYIYSTFDANTFRVRGNHRQREKFSSCVLIQMRDSTNMKMRREYALNC